MKNLFAVKTIKNLISLLRWDKPSGRLILLIPAGWSLWLTPSAPPNGNLFTLIMLGGLLVSGSGCIANDIWDRKIDLQVIRTKERPLANKQISITAALALLIFLLLVSLQIILLLPSNSQGICLQLAAFSLIPILIYPSSKRWFKFPQFFLAICWGFSVLIPWAASEANLDGGITLLTCWLASMIWTFGFDTVYAMADQHDDKRIGLNSSALALGTKAYRLVSICYGLTSLLIAISALGKGIELIFWPFWIIATIGMQREVFTLKPLEPQITKISRHFKNQVLLGGLIFLGLVLSNI